MNVRMKESNINLSENVKHLALVACKVGPAFQLVYKHRDLKKKLFLLKLIFNGMFHVSIDHRHHLLYRVGFLMGKIQHPQEPALAGRM